MLQRTFPVSGGAGAHSVGTKVVLADLTSQKYSRFGMHRGVIGKTLHVFRLMTQNPRGTLGRFIGPFVKVTLATFFGVQFYETLYFRRLHPPWEQ